MKAYCVSKMSVEKGRLRFSQGRGAPFDHEASLDHLNTGSADIDWLVDGSPKELVLQLPLLSRNCRDVGDVRIRTNENLWAAATSSTPAASLPIHRTP